MNLPQALFEASQQAQDLISQLETLKAQVLGYQAQIRILNNEVMTLDQQLKVMKNETR